MFFKAKNEIVDSSFLVKTFSLEIFFSRYFTEQGKIYRRKYWQFFIGSFVMAGLIFIAMNFGVPEFRQELNGF